MARTLREYTALQGTGFSFDEATRTLDNVAICGLKSRNGYAYAEKALREAAPLYADVPVFLNHGNGRTPTDRDARDLAGKIVGTPTFDGERLRGRIEILETDAGRILASLVKSAAPRVGLSHVVSATMPRGKKLVESIQQVVSVDAVAFPATVDGFSEQDHGDGQMDYAEANFSGLKAARPDLIAEAVRESGLESKLAESAREMEAMRAKLDAFETRDRLAARRTGIVESAKAAGLDPADQVVFPESLMQSLMDCADDAVRQARVADHAKLVKSLKESATAPAAPPVNGTRKAPEEKPWSPETHFAERFAVVR